VHHFASVAKDEPKLTETIIIIIITFIQAHIEGVSSHAFSVILGTCEK
jgi:hypothetical protein